MTTEDCLALRRTAEIYARGADRRSREDWIAVLTDDVEISGPGFCTKGLDASLGSLDMLGRMFMSTRHLIHNQLVEIDGARAAGETYCTAEHRISGEDGDTLLCWAIRYQDQWRRENGTWKISRRELIVDWEEVRPLKQEQTG